MNFLWIFTTPPRRLFFACSVIFFCISVYFTALAPLPWNSSNENSSIQILYPVFNQPDEAVNYFFLRDLLVTKTPGVVEPLSITSDSQVHPRGTTILESSLAPGGFPGFITLLFLLIWPFYAIFGEASIPITASLIVPVLASITPYFLYIIFRQVFDEKNARISALLLFILPPWFYLSSRPLQMTVPFVFCLITSLFFLFASAQTRYPKIYTFISGVLLALALFIRPSEALWVMAVAVFLLYRVRKMIDPKIFVFWLLGVFLVGVLFFVNQNWWYGSPLATGYAVPRVDGSAATIFEQPQGRAWWQGFFLPFGLHPITVLKTVYQYNLQLFPLWTIAGIFGLYLFFKLTPIRIGKTFGSIHPVYVGVSVAIAVFLFISYGSWNFVDNTLGTASIGSSQVRYFLPIYILSLPFVVIGVKLFISFFARKNLVLFFVLCSLLFSSTAVLFGPPEGLWSLRKTLNSYVIWRENILKRTEAHAVVVTRYADKYIFPYRKVIPGFTQSYELEAIRSLLDHKVPVYWYDVAVSKDEYAEISQNISQYNLTLSSPTALWSDLELRRIELKK